MESKLRSKRQDQRRRQILGAALKLMRQYGTGISTAQIAAEANCSKETLYNWFGDRDGIFLALVEEQAQGMSDALARSFSRSQEGRFKEKLQAYALALLDIMTGEAVIAVNRAAMADACREHASLGLAVLDDWQARVAVPFLELFEEGILAGTVEIEDPMDAFEVLMGLLVGDRQRRLLLGEDARPSNSEIAEIAKTAVQRWITVFRR